MLNELDILGIYVSPLLLCIVLAYCLRILLSYLLLRTGFYRLIAQRPIFDSALLISLTGLVFHVFAIITTPTGHSLS
ncbi:DUF1656 domain-containing protein [Photobacterium ganghwense]|uniref:DUF1656 domain-containing protein n=1 Tax=Photobacterium ganghwense TaxID=320778 RepID=UPI0009FE7F0F|nr:DUF1656 domain-containing protein [Photobacterium ganghwense]QSV15872.1 DUF1656 domain-containing protein [Photobacterium ganghwense]